MTELITNYFLEGKEKKNSFFNFKNFSSKFVKNITFGQYAQIWENNYGKKELSPTTLCRYKTFLNTRILPFFSEMRLDKITPIDIMNFYTILEEDTQIKRVKNNNNERVSKPLSKKSILEHHRLLRSMLQKAVYWQIIESNAAARVETPKVTKPPKRYYDDKQCRILLKNLEDEDLMYKLIITLDLYTGMRLGELLALEWKDINFKTRMITINKSLQYLPSLGIFIKSPKTQSSVRDVSIPTNVIVLLKQYKEKYKTMKTSFSKDNKKTERLFVRTDGSNMYPNYISKWFSNYVDKIGLPVINFHGLRHTNASLLISQNIDIAVVAARLGHSQISTTLNFYVHPVKSHNRTAGNTLQRLLNSN